MVCCQQASKGSHSWLQNCERALTQVHPGQRVNCLPGVLSLAQKHRLVHTLTSHYGEGAFELIPRSWLLPSRYWHWRLWAEAQVLTSQTHPRPAPPNPLVHVLAQTVMLACKLST